MNQEARNTPEPAPAPTPTPAREVFPEEKKRCEWQRVFGQPARKEGLIYRCIHCGFVTDPTWNPDALARECPEPNRVKQLWEVPSFIARMANFAADYAQHLSQGSPESSEAVILERFRVCSGCPLYQDLTGVCTVCGCYVNLYLAKDNMNKLGWLDAACPEGKWQAFPEEKVASENR